MNFIAHSFVKILIELESRLYEKFPEYGNSSNNFMINGNRVNSHKTLEDNHINDSDVVILYRDKI